MILHPPNTFLPYWTNKQLKDWLKELKWRNRNKETREIYKHSMVPTIEQTKAELANR